MNLINLITATLVGMMGNSSNNAANVPVLQSITEAQEKSREGSITSTWDNVNSSFILLALTIIAALGLNYNCYGKEKRIWIDDCILNQIVILVVLSLLFNVDSRAIPSSLSTTALRSATNTESETFIETNISNTSNALSTSNTSSTSNNSSSSSPSYD